MSYEDYIKNVCEKCEHKNQCNKEIVANINGKIVCVEDED
jgi:hypothetical protein